MSEIDELARLHDLFVRGAITREEFAAMKAKIIAEPPGMARRTCDHVP